MTLSIGRDTENIVLDDSQGKHLDEKLLFGKGKTHIKKCYMSNELTDFTEQLKCNQMQSNQDIFIVRIMYNDISLYNILHLNITLLRRHKDMKNDVSVQPNSNPFTV